MRRFFKSRTDRKICGVCGGIAAAFGIDSTVVRVVLMISMFCSLGTTIVVYFIAALCLKEDDIEVVGGAKPRLCKSRKDKKIFGVCGGIAEYLDIDAFIVRMLFVFAVMFLGFGIITYLVFAMMLPKESLHLE